MGDFSGAGNIGDSGVIELIGKVVVIAIILVLFVVVIVFCIHIYARWLLSRRGEDADVANTTTRRRRRFDGHQEIAMVRRGLDPSVLKTLPVAVYDPKDFKEGLECAVCLCDVSEGEKARILPKCNHGFHVQCIDMWFQSHSTCPICRNLVSSDDQIQKANSGTTTNESNLGSGADVVTTTEAASLPTNVLFWGDETRVTTSALAPHVGENQDQVDNCVNEPSSSSSSSSSPVEESTNVKPNGALAIDIPRQIDEDEEQKTPVQTRLKSLTRLFSGNSRRVNPSSPRNLDLEQGGRGQS